MLPKENENHTAKDFLSFTEACEFLDCSESYLYKLTHLKKITHYKPNGKKLYFNKADLRKWITKKKIKSRR
ncbi:MAG: DNA-binding protein [Ignavibacteriae bacterium]|nr:DNA-binding protein [Ignavibacteriota bacterium]